MDLTLTCPLAAILAARLRASRTELTARWLERIGERVSLDPNRIFPTDELLDHVPLLIAGVAEFLENPASALAADTAVAAHARALGALRHEQGFDEFEILKEFEIFGGILFAFLTRTADDIEEPCTRSELLMCAQRLFQAITLIQQATATQYLQLMKRKLREREERLRAFNRALTHELRNRINATAGAGQLLELSELPESKRLELAGVVARNASGMQVVLEHLLELSRLDSDARQHRHVRLPAAAFEVSRQLRDAAAAANVEIRIAQDLPDIEVNAAAVQLCLTNLMSNAIKYADLAKPIRWVEVRGHLVHTANADAGEAVIEVCDNGIGIPETQRPHLFERFARGEDAVAQGTDGLGLGLSIVRETVEALCGRVWAEFPGEGSVFAFAIPARRAGEGGELGHRSR